MPQKQVVLPADVYDALELSALVHGGIGAEYFIAEAVGDNPPPPLCVMGHAEFLDNAYMASAARVPVTRAVLAAFGLNEAQGYGLGPIFSANDRAVRKLVHGNADVPVLDSGKRVTWEQWCKETGVVRGE